MNRVSEPTLASIQSSGQLLAPREALDLLREVVRRVVDLHSSGQLHLGITLDAISTGPDGIKLKMAEDTASLESLRELLKWSPEASHRLPRSLPTNLGAARQMLATSRIETDPCTFDLLAIGDVFCRMLTGESSAVYRQSVRVKGLVPLEFRTLLERLLGADGQLSFKSARSLRDFLQEHHPDDSDAHKTLPGRTKDFQPTPTGDNSNTGVALIPADDGTAPAPVKRSVSTQGNEDLPFQKLGHFEIQARIGHGGMGDVYRAYERPLDRTVAIKVLPAEFARQTDFVRRFQAEASAVAKLVHPNIIQIYFIGIDSGHHFFAMQYVDGFSLAVLLNEKKKLSVNTAVSLVEQVLRGLQEAHSLGFVHRDIKPGNILIDRVKQRALLADFGLVKMVEGSETGMTATGVTLGTVDYLSPEQARGKDVDARSDLYSLGVLLYHILSGQLPFVADTPTALMFLHVYEKPRPLTEVAPQVAKPLATIVNKLMEKNPADRYQSARDVLTDLAAFRNKQPLVFASQSGSDCIEDAVRSPPFSASPIENLTLPEEVEPAVATSGWERWLNRWRAKFQQHAPQRLLDLQNTQQQLQGGLAVYETRRENLEKLVQEAQDVRNELARAAAQCRGTSDAAPLEQQLARHDEQLDDLKLKLAKVSSTLQQLLSQRDLLNARLKATDTQLRSDSQINSSRFLRRYVLLFAATATLVVVAAFITGRLVRQSRLASDSGSEEASPDSEAAGTADPENRGLVFVYDNGQRLRNSIGMEFVRIAPGEFMMGSPIREVGRDPDERQHFVRITQPFFMGIHEVTRGQFEQFVAETGYRTNAETDGKGGYGEYPGVGGRFEKRFTWRDSGYEQTSDHPVGNVTWYDASAFVRWLSEKENVVYRLPTEAEAEYACRAGSQTPFQTGTVAADVVQLANVVDLTFRNELITKYKKDVSNLKSTPGSDGFVFTAPVGSFPANPFGLHDMIGNVDEWCSDWFDHHYFSHSPVNDPTGPESGVFRSFRGGFWGSIVQHTRCANRSRFEPDHRANYIGFRVVRNVTPVNPVDALCFGGTGSDAGNGIAVDSAGNVYTTGFFEGTADFDPGAGVFNLTSAGGLDIFVTKQDSAGNLVWANRMGGKGADAGNAVVLGDDGTVCVTGYFEVNADFDPGARAFNLTSAGGSDIFVANLDNAGNLVWAKRMGGTSNDYGLSIAVDAAGYVNTTGRFFVTVDFDPGDGVFNLTSAGDHDIFISQLDSDGHFSWAKRIGGSTGDNSLNITVDAASNVYTTGYWNGVVDFDSGAGVFNLSSAGLADIFVAKLDTAGNFLWTRSMGGTGDDLGYSIAVDVAGSVYAAGIFRGTADFDPGVGVFNLTSPGDSSIFVSKLDSEGNFAWARRFGGAVGDLVHSMATDAAGNVYTAGNFSGSADFDPGAGVLKLTSAGMEDIFVAKLDSAGDFGWAQRIGSSISDVAHDIAIDATGNIHATGFFCNTADFDPGTGVFNLTSAGLPDVFVSKLSPSFPLQ